MKKLLAMVLALVMTLSLAVSANAAFEDAKDINATYAEAVDVLAGMKVFQGYDNGKTFKPQGDITRAEVAAIVYRIYTADVKDSYVKNYETYNKFSDMAGAGWAKGYIGYCANAALVKGYPNGTFQPSGKVTGYEVLAMILRAVGYDKNNEFTGADWALHVAQIAEQNKILKNVKGIDLSAPASRELVAELLFQAIQVPTVTYTAAFGYQDVSLTADKKTDKLVKANSSLGYKNFKLISDVDSDIWGRPTTVWAKDVNESGKYESEKDSAYATIVATPDASFNVATSQCDICEALGEKKEAKVVEAYNNGKADKTLLETYKATATKAMVGAQGRQIEVYDVKDGYRLVVIDTYLAYVNEVVAEKLDGKGHISRDAYLQLDGFTTKDADNTDSKKIETLYVKGNDYAEGDWLLVNVNEVDTTQIVLTSNKKAEDVKTVEVVGKAESFDGAQSKIYTKAYKHTIGDKDYMDAYRFYLNEAGNDGSVKYTWFLDQFGNLIGSIAIDNTNYAVLKDICWTGTKTGYAEATLVYMDGTEETVKVNTIDGVAAQPDSATKEFNGAFDSDYNNCEPKVDESSKAPSFDKDYAYMSAYTNYNGAYEGMALYLVETNEDGTVNLQGEPIHYAAGISLKADSTVMLAGVKYALTNSTKVLVRDTNDKDEYIYTPSTVKELATYADNSVTVYFTAENGFVTRIYVKYATDESAFGKYIFMPWAQDSNAYYDTNAKSWFINVYVDGELKTIEADPTVAAYLQKNEGKLFEVTRWAKAYNAKNYGSLLGVKLVHEGNDTDNWAKGENADYITGCTLKDNAIRSTSKLNASALNVIDLDGAKVIVWDDKDAKIEKLTKDMMNEYGVWAVSKDTKYEGFANVIYLGKKLDTNTGLTVTVADDKTGTVSYDTADAQWKFVSAAGVETATLVYAPTSNLANVTPESAPITSRAKTALVTVTSEAGFYEAHEVALTWTPAPEVTTAKVNDLVVKVDGTKISTAESTVYKNLADAVKNATEVSLASVNNATVSIEGGAHWVQGEVCGNSDIALASTANGQTHGQNTDSVTNANIASNTYIVVGVGVDSVNHYIAYVIK